MAARLKQVACFPVVGIAIFGIVPGKEVWIIALIAVIIRAKSLIPFSVRNRMPKPGSIPFIRHWHKK
ncbi:hypothetical protein NT017_23590 [Prolixibacter sp. NT017]|nr:hypothetical protein NT017_23590 [Prolixibacter sp. NT017]